MNNRWWIYQKERFPIFAHGPLVIIFCLAVLLFSALQGETLTLPSFQQIAGAVVSALIMFFQLRVADEFKDFAIDSRYRPHRPVPRGLVSLPELARLAYAGAAIQFVIAISIDIGLVPLLFGLWLYAGLMTKEFFVAEWLQRHPAIYLVSHMLIMPLIAFYVSAFAWLCDCSAMPAGLGWLLALAFSCGLVLELGRKIHVPENERTGVESYSALWGAKVAIALWVLSVVAAVVSYSMAVTFIAESAIYLRLAESVLLLGSIAVVLFPRKGCNFTKGKNIIEPSSGLVALLLYLGLGPLQLLLG
jgi:4-hydroxybenzoate polyprenyltransferase